MVKQRTYHYYIDFKSAKEFKRGLTVFASVPVYYDNKYLENRLYTRIELVGFLKRRRRTNKPIDNVRLALKKIFNIDIE